MIRIRQSWADGAAALIDEYDRDGVDNQRAVAREIFSEVIGKLGHRPPRRGYWYEPESGSAL